MEPINLDDLSVYPNYDSQGMLALIKELPEQYRLAWQAVQDFKVPESFRDVDNVIILGMGGSAIGGDLADQVENDVFGGYPWRERAVNAQLQRLWIALQ